MPARSLLPTCGRVPNETRCGRCRKNIADKLASISGGGTADIVASGTTKSPILDASINLQNVAYRDPVSKERSGHQPH